MTHPRNALSRRLAVLALHLGLLALPAISACRTPARAGDALASGAQATVTIDNFTFSPRRLTIAPGTTVTWVNHDDIPHTVVEENRAFRSRALDTDDRFSFTFTRAGDFSYFCSLHPRMTGRITVMAGAG